MNSERYLRAQHAGATRPTRCALTGQALVPCPCDCDPPRAHGPHWRRASDADAGSLLQGALRALTRKTARTPIPESEAA